MPSLLLTVVNPHDPPVIVLVAKIDSFADKYIYKGEEKSCNLKYSEEPYTDIGAAATASLVMN